MGYKIQYEPELNHKYQIPGITRFNKRWLFGGGIAMAVILAALIPAVRQWIWAFVIPGDAEITKATFLAMLSDIREGVPLSDAVTAFCQEIIANG